MSKDIEWLAWTLGMTALFWMPYVLYRIASLGLLGAVGNYWESDKPVAAWALRAQRAHANAIENLALYAPAVLAVQLLNLNNATTAFAGSLYFGSRLAHYIVQTAGFAFVRTLAFFGGWIAIAMLILRLLGLL